MVIVNINERQERIERDEKITNLTTEIAAVERMITHLKGIEHYLMAIDRPPEVIPERVHLKTRKRFLINKLTRLQG